jgi:hypothetical protein
MVAIAQFGRMPGFEVIESASPLQLSKIRGFPPAAQAITTWIEENMHLYFIEWLTIMQAADGTKLPEYN